MVGQVETLLGFDHVHHEETKDDNHPDTLIVFSSHAAHVFFEHYRSRERSGVVHLYSVEELFEARGDYLMRVACVVRNRYAKCRGCFGIILTSKEGHE